jgi:flagellar FliL protein
MNKKLLIVLILAAVLVLAMLGGGFYLMWSKIASLETPGQGEEAAVEGEEEAGPTAIGVTFPLETFIVNLADEGGKRYLRVTMQLELVAGETDEPLRARLPQIRDVILMTLPTKRFEDIRSAEGKINLRTEIMEQLNRLFPEALINNIYFTEFVVQ